MKKVSRKKQEETRPAALILEELKRTGIRYVVSLPDNWLTELLQLVEKDPDIHHIPVAREEEGVGICAGIHMAGKDAAMIVQNTGLFLSCNALHSLAWTFRIPVFMLISNRGDLDDDKVYQTPKGVFTRPLLDALQIPHFEVEGPDQVSHISKAHRFSKLTNLPVAVLLNREALGIP